VLQRVDLCCTRSRRKSALKCGVVYCSVAVCCSMLQYVAVCCSVLQYVAVCCARSRRETCIRVLRSVLQCVAACCSVLQCITMCCSVLRTKQARKVCKNRQCIFFFSTEINLFSILYVADRGQCQVCSRCVAVCFSVFQCVAVCCSVLQCVAVFCSVMDHGQCQVCSRFLGFVGKQPYNRVLLHKKSKR